MYIWLCDDLIRILSNIFKDTERIETNASALINQLAVTTNEIT